ncbi:heme-binding protein 2 [Callorhinchus milii]|uniref:Heme-binding protein 1 n=1 Tax=Callorhinchus milii TaxID=7868 RepID=A0A4W3H763_CALMI|nr:heme-binding protein 2 [Callorhinchus milii]
MSWTGLILVVFLGLTNAEVSDSQCRETKECLEYVVNCESPDYEIRHYKRSKWVATDITSWVMEYSVALGFGKLFAYIQGNNKGGQKMNMTTPVLIKIQKADMSVNKYTVYFLLPKSHQHDPPTPLFPEIYFADLPRMDAYVKSFGGWMFSFNSKHYSAQLAKQLMNASASFDSSYFYAAVYNRPLKIIGRHNEVWYIAKGKPECPSSRF